MVSTRTARRHAASSHDDLPAWLRDYEHLHIDIGTGDGTFALDMARRHPDMAVIGLDTCLDNVTKAARRPQANLRFLACDAERVPDWLHRRATSVSINFPYGSLFHAVAGADPLSWERLLAVARPGAHLDIHVNASAGAEYGVAIDAMHTRLARSMRCIAPGSATIDIVPHDAMRTFPTTWAKRLAYGRPSQVIVATGLFGV